MSDIAKGYIRWWKNRVMDYEGDKQGAYDTPYPTGCTGADFNKWAETRKWIVEPYEDKPIDRIFTCTMKLQGFYRGRSAAGLLFHDEEGREHTMRIKCVVELLKQATLVQGSVFGQWRYVKQGANYSLKYVAG